MNSQQIKTEIETAQARKEQITGDVARAAEALKQADLRFIDGKISMEELTAFQSAHTALGRALASIDARITQLTTDHQAALKTEAFDAYGAEVTEIENEKKAVADRFAKAAEKASEQFAKMVEALRKILQEHTDLAIRAHAAHRRLSAADKQAAEKINVSQYNTVFDAAIHKWTDLFVGPLAPQIITAVVGDQRRTAPPAAQPSEPVNEAARRLSQPAAGNEAAKRLGRPS